MSGPEPAAEEKCYKFILEVLSGENGAFTKDGAKSTLDKACKYHTQSCLQAIAKEVEERLKDYDITDYMDKEQVYDALDASNPQEVGEIKQLVWFYHLITKHLDQ